MNAYALNGELGKKLNSPALATTILFTVGAVVSLVYLFFNDDLTKTNFKEPIPPYFYLGGLLVMFYILSVSWVGPVFGIGNAISFVLLGQIISIAIIDHYGLFGMLHHPLTTQRLIGLLCMSLGVILAIRRV